MTEHTYDLLGLPELQDVQELERRQIALRQSLDNSIASEDAINENVAAAFIKADATASENITRILGDPDLQQRIVAVGKKALNATGKLDTMLGGLMSPADIEVLKAQEIAKVEAVRGLFERYPFMTDTSGVFGTEATMGGLAVAVANVPEAIQPDELRAKPEARVRRPINITIRDKAVKIGEDGRVVSFASRLAEEGRAQDYSAYTKRALNALIDNPHKRFKTMELWDAMTPEGEPYSKHVMQVVRTWLLDLVPGDDKLVFWSEKRGRGSFYWLSPDYDISVTRKLESEHVTQTKAEARAVEKLSLAEREVVPGLTNGDLFYLAYRLKSFAKVFESYDKPIISDELMDRLDIYRRDMKDIRDNGLEEYREELATKLYTHITNDDKLLDLIDAIDSESPLADLLEYIYSQYGTKADRRFISNMIGAKIVHEYQTLKGMPDGVVATVIGADGSVMWTSPTGLAKSGASESTTDPVSTADQIKTKVETVAREVLIDPVVHRVDEAATKIAEVIHHAAEKAAPKEVEVEKPFVRKDEKGNEYRVDEERSPNTKKRKQFENLVKHVDCMAERWLTHFAADAVLKSGQIQGAIGTFRGKWQGVDVEENFGLMDCIMMDLRHSKDTKSLFNGNKKIAKRAEEVAQKRLERFLAADQSE